MATDQLTAEKKEAARIKKSETDRQKAGKIVEKLRMQQLKEGEKKRKKRETAAASGDHYWSEGVDSPTEEESEDGDDSDVRSVGITRDPWEGKTGKERTGKTAPKDRWKVISHLVDPQGKKVHGVDMFGRLLKEGECLHYAGNQLLEDDGVGYLVDEYIRAKCNFPPWTDDLAAKERMD